VYTLVDDFGWADAGWHRPDNYTDVRTPGFNALVKEGVELDRHYVFKMCSPTRSAVQVGRNPIHVNVLNIVPQHHNPKDPVSGYAGIPRNMTGIAEILSRAGYVTHMYGKWDAGMATWEHSPRGRGYQHSLFYFHHSNDYWKNTEGSCHGTPVVDLWEDTKPAHGLNNSQECSQDNQAEGCVYEDAVFNERVMNVLRTHNLSTPLFLFWAPHIVHMPLSVPNEWLDRFSAVDNIHRRFYHSMVGYVDEAIWNATQVMKERGMWDNTLMVVHADNGGPIYFNCGGNNYPLKGGKMANWEGGIRVNAFVVGGFVPEKVRGTKQEGYITGWDWYTTFAHLAGEDFEDKKAAAAGLPPVDGVNVWPLVSGQVSESPRTEIALGDEHEVTKATKIGGLIRGDYKIVIGIQTQSGWPGPEWPNATIWWPFLALHECGETPKHGCLFNIKTDPTEHHNIAAENPELFKDMLARAKEYEKNVFSPHRGLNDPKACELAMGRYGGFWGPFVGV